MSRRLNYQEVKGSEIDRDRVYMQTAGFTPVPTWLPISRKFRFRRVAASSGATISEKVNIKQTRLETFWERHSLFQVMSPWEGTAFRLWPRAACPLPSWLPLPTPCGRKFGTPFVGQVLKKSGGRRRLHSLCGGTLCAGAMWAIYFFVCLEGFSERRIKEL